MALNNIVVCKAWIMTRETKTYASMHTFFFFVVHEKIKQHTECHNELLEGEIKQ